MTSWPWFACWLFSWPSKLVLLLLERLLGLDDDASLEGACALGVGRIALIPSSVGHLGVRDGDGRFARALLLDGDVSSGGELLSIAEPCHRASVHRGAMSSR
uniref:Secreted protein n=1 Tax=Steinernema glaseri TaxID=37863 RepID=A0A1I8A302_9BILA